MTKTNHPTFHTITQQHFIESNLIEGVTDLGEVPKAIIAWDYLSKLSTVAIHQRDVLHVHGTLMTGLMAPRDVGEWRTTNVRVGGRICPHHVQVPELMQEWIEAFWDESDLSPKEMHVLFEHIHPFRDGNGRTGRMLMWWHQALRGEEPTLITYKEREAYYDWF